MINYRLKIVNHNENTRLYIYEILIKYKHLGWQKQFVFHMNETYIHPFSSNFLRSSKELHRKNLSSEQVIIIIVNLNYKVQVELMLI